LIGAIGEQVLAMACADFAAGSGSWATRAPRLLAVNLSRAQLNQPGLCERVGAIMAANGMQPGSLQLEIRERRRRARISRISLWA
jgi:EAL domain-containing protein (putative c-di-GMP-specific phosphodiesterase class I)